MFAQCNGAQIHYELFGTGDKKLVLLHGWGCSIDTFAPVIHDLESSFSLLVCDFPGHGLSPEPPCPWSVTEFMEGMAELLKTTGFAGAGIIAHSFGCRVAILLAATYPELVGRMLLTGAAGIPAQQTATASFSQKAAKRLKTVLEKPIFSESFREKAQEAFVQRFGSADYKALTPSMRLTFNRMLRQDLTDCLPKIQSPVFLFWGELDTATPLWMAERMKSAISDCALLVIPGASHFAFLEACPRFLSIARAFFVE